LPWAGRHRARHHRKQARRGAAAPFISGGKLNLRKSRVALGSILGSAVETSLPLIEAARHELSVEAPDEELVVDADATRIAQVVANLLNNAARYTPPGGRISLALRREGEDALISVTGTGVGIPQHALDSVFEMFIQVGSESERSQGGLGIGLSLVRELVQLHGGSVVAESAGAGAGSRFTVRLPLAIEEARAEAPGSAAASSTADPADAATGVRVLVVDDNVDAAVTLSMILDVGGYATQGAEHDRARSAAAGFDHHLTKPVELATVQALLAAVAGHIS
jgi:two-component sensor histidine kinase